MTWYDEKLYREPDVPDNSRLIYEMTRDFMFLDRDDNSLHMVDEIPYEQLEPLMNIAIFMDLVPPTDELISPRNESSLIEMIFDSGAFKYYL